MEDEKIIEMFYARSEDAIDCLGRKYGALCMNIARNILKSESDAQECVNDAYLGAWNSIPPQNPNPLSAYICRIVRNISTARYHKNTAKCRNSYYDAALDEIADCLADTEGDGSVSAKELAQALDSFIDTLSTENRVIFMRRYWFGDSAEDIAVRMKSDRNRIYVRLHRIRENLKKYLEKEGFEI